MRLNDLKDFLIKRGYNGEFVESQFSRVRKVNRFGLLSFSDCSRRGGTKDNTACFVVDYHPALRSLYGIFRELQSIVKLSNDFSSILPEKTMLSFRRPRNLKDDFVRLAKLCKQEAAVGGMFKRGGKKCKVCNSIVVGDTFKSSVSGRKFYIYHHFNCDSQEVIHLITCRQRAKQCVGSTVAAFRLRFNHHKRSLNRFGNGQKDICGRHLCSHFYGEGHLGLDDFLAQVIDVRGGPLEK